MSDLLTVGGIMLATLAGSKEVRETACKLVGNVLEPLTAEAGQIIASPLQKLRTRLAGRVVERAAVILVENQAAVEAVPPKLLVSILDGCSLEENDEMADRWARLLASAATGSEIHPAYPRVLEELATLEAKLLDEFDPYMGQKGAEQVGPPDELHRIARDNLARLQLTNTPSWYTLYGKFYLAGLSHFGWDFVQKCHGPGFSWEVYKDLQYAPPA